MGCSEGTISAHPSQVWLCFRPRPSASSRVGGLALSQADYGNCPSLKYLPSLKVLLTAFFIFFFLYLFKEPCNFFLFLSFSPPLSFFFLVPSVPLNSLKLALCLLTPN